MKVAGEYRPPLMGFQVESFPVSGAGELEVTPTALRLEGSRGFPIEVTLLGLLGLALGFVVAYFLHRGRRWMIALIAGGMFGGSSVGYALSRRRTRKRDVVEVPVAKVVEVDVDAAKGALQITVQIRRRWQNRKQMISFYPSDLQTLAPLAEAVRARRT